MYARGMSVREIQAFLAESYGTEVSPDFISSVTDEVMAQAMVSQSRPLEVMSPVVFFDALRVKIRSHGVVSDTAVYLRAAFAWKYAMNQFAIMFGRSEEGRFGKLVVKNFKPLC